MTGANRKFGSYVLGPRLGVGGMAAAYEATKQGPGGFEHKVCLKRVLPVYREDADFRRLFFREAKIAAALRHSNIVGVIDFGEVDGEPYLALELIDGLDLRTVVRNQEGKRLPVDEVLLIGTEVARALEYAHNVSHEGGAGVLHRDISPSNVLVSAAGEVKLGDFGIAKLMGSAGATASSAVRGKLSYLAPETAEGDNVDVRADIFALGVMLYELCHGRRPFDGNNDSQTFAAIQAGQARAWDLDAGPAGLETLVLSMIARDPQERPASAEALLEALMDVRKSLSDYGDLGPRRALSARVRSVQAAQSPDDEVARTAALELDEALAEDLANQAPVAQMVRGTPDEPTKTQHAPSSAETPRVDGSPTNTHDKATHLLEATAGEQASHQRKRSWRWPAIVGGALVLLITAFAFSRSQGEPEATPKSDVGAADLAAANSLAASNLAASNVAASSMAAKDTAAKDTAAKDTAAKSTDAGISDADALDAEVDNNGEPSEGRVHITVIPWGNVWTDGTRRGRAPRWVSLKPGVHRIAGGRNDPEKTRSIRVQAGKSRRLMIDLGEP